MRKCGARPKLPDLSIAGGSSYVDKKTAARVRHRAKTLKFPFKIPSNESAAVRKSWRYYEKHLAPRGYWVEGDQDGLLELCRIKVDMHDMKVQIDADGKMIEVKNVSGIRTKKLHPLWNAYQKLHSRWMTMLYEYGLTPIGRIKLGVSTDGGIDADRFDRDDPANEFFD